MTAKKRYPSDKQDQYIVRFPDGMRDRLKDEAAKNGRSLNAEIIQRLTASLELDDYVPKVNAHEDTAELVINSLSPREKALVSAIVEAIRSPSDKTGG